MKSTLERTQYAIETLNLGTTPQDICDGLAKFTGQYGLTSMIAGTMPSPRDRRKKAQEEHLLLSGFPSEWMERYLSQSYVHVDPVIKRIQSNLEPFSWEEAVPFIDRKNEKVVKQMFGEAGEHDLRVGFTVPMITLDGSIAAVSFGGERLDMPPEAAGMISLAASFAISRAIELRSQGQLRKNAGITKRELECLKWAADGKTEWEIGVVLGIAEKTVDTHLYSAHRKLGAANRPQAIALAFRLGLID